MKVMILSKKKLKIYLMIIFITVITLILYFGNTKDIFFLNQKEEPIRNGNPQSNRMAFTCNVDWGNEVIPKLLEILDEKDVKITFFISGRWATHYPEMVKLIKSKGHEIGNHGYSHKMHSQIGEAENYNEIKKTEDAIAKAVGTKPIYFAPPAGDFSETTLEVAAKLGYKTILWSVDTIDWKEGSTAQVIINRVMKKPHNGAILLMHPKEESIKALPYIIDQIQGEGIHIGRVSDLLKE